MTDTQWNRIRDPETTEVYYELIDNESVVANIHKYRNGYRAQVLDHQPYTCLKLNTAKSSAAHIYSTLINGNQ